MLKYSIYWRTEQPCFLTIRFIPELKVLPLYLSHVFDRSSYEWVMEGVDGVLSGKLIYIERDLEWYGANINRDTTTFYVTIDEKNKDKDVINTEHFKEILNAWIKEKEKFDEWKRKQS